MGKGNMKSACGLRRLLGVAVVSALAFTFIGPANATYEQGLEAYKKGQYEQAIDLWTRFAIAGDVRSKNVLGDVYSNKILEVKGGAPDPGEERRPEYVKALLWYTLAAYHDFLAYQQPTTDEVNARILAGIRLPEVRYRMTEREVKQAEALVVQTLESGSGYDLYRLGDMYQKGAGIGKNNVKAMTMYVLAKRRNVEEASAAFNILQELMSQSDIDHATQDALKWLPPLPPEFNQTPPETAKLAALKKELEALKLEDALEAVSDIDVELIQRALNALGFRAGAVDNNMGETTRAAIKRFQFSTVARNTKLTAEQKAAVQTGVLSPTQTALLFKEAASSGHPMSQYVYGIMHVRGIGVKQDGKMAVTHLKDAADANLAIAHYALGVIYRGGTTGLNEVAPDRVLAARYFARASVLGYGPATKALEELDLEAPRDNQ